MRVHCKDHKVSNVRRPLADCVLNDVWDRFSHSHKESFIAVQWIQKTTRWDSVVPCTSSCSTQGMRRLRSPWLNRLIHRGCRDLSFSPSWNSEKDSEDSGIFNQRQRSFRIVCHMFLPSLGHNSLLAMLLLLLFLALCPEQKRYELHVSSLGPMKPLAGWQAWIRIDKWFQWSDFQFGLLSMWTYVIKCDENDKSFVSTSMAQNLAVGWHNGSLYGAIGAVARGWVGHTDIHKELKVVEIGGMQSFFFLNIWMFRQTWTANMAARRGNIWPWPCE